MEKGKLIKLTDDVFNGNHPNNIGEGYVARGFIVQKPVVGSSCIVGDLRTSTVTKVLKDGVFKTLNSTYKLEIINESKTEKL